MALAPPVPVAMDPAVLRKAAAHLPPTGSLTFSVEDRSVTYSVDATAGSVLVEEGCDHGTVAVRLSRPAWDDLVGQVRTFVGLYLGDELVFERGGFGQLADWDPVLRYLHAGLPPYDPSEVDFEGRDPAAAFDAGTDDAELAAQLRTMGYLHVTGVFSAGEMEEANQEIDRLAAAARPDDDQSWWVTAADGSRALCRLVYASLRSPFLASLERDPRVRRFGTLLDRRLRTAPDRMEGAAVLLKVPGATTGLSNIPWHQDCGTGGHAIFCPSVAVGIQLTGSSAATGNLQVVPGSHGKVLHHRWQDHLAGVPVVDIDTAPGDVTVHVQDVMHASPAPTGAGYRRTMYVTYYPPPLWDHIGSGQALNDLVRNRTEQVARLQGRPSPGPAATQQGTTQQAAE